ncbi:MAG: histidine kinase dimerization/phospho-acceptor domain-containing protein, partial [Bacteroidota bacterium]
MLNYSPDNWITIVGGLAIFVMGLRVYYLDTSNRMYLAFLGTTFFLFLQNCFFAEMDNVTAYEQAQLMRPWQESSWNFAIVCIVITFWYYAKQFNDREMKDWEAYWLYLVLALSPICILMQAFTPYGHGALTLQPENGWYIQIDNPGYSDYFRTLWTILIYSLSTYLSYLAAAASKFSKRRWVRWAIFGVFGLIMIVTFSQNYVMTMVFKQLVPINETINVLVGGLFTGLMIINLQFHDLQSEYAVPNLMQTMTNWFVLVDENLQIKQVNEVFLEMMGRNQKYWQNTPIDIVFGKKNEEWLKTKDILFDLQENEKASFEIKLAAKGETVFLSFVITPITDDSFWKFGDTRQGFSFVGTDLSEFKQSEEQIRAYANDLETSNKALERFAYIASHDLKEPIRNIGNFAGLLKRRLPPSSQVKVAEYIQFIEQNVAGMNKLIDAVLTVSRLRQEEFAYEAIETDRVFSKIN